MFALRLGIVVLLLLVLRSEEALAEAAVVEAARGGDVAAVGNFLDAGVGVGERDQALFAASKTGHTEVVSLLLAHWSDANFVMPRDSCCEGWSPLLCPLPIAAAEGLTGTRWKHC